MHKSVLTARRKDAIRFYCRRTCPQDRYQHSHDGTTTSQTVSALTHDSSTSDSSGTAGMLQSSNLSDPRPAKMILSEKLPAAHWFGSLKVGSMTVVVASCMPGTALTLF